MLAGQLRRSSTILQRLVRLLSKCPASRSRILTALLLLLLTRARARLCASLAHLLRQTRGGAVPQQMRVRALDPLC